MPQFISIAGAACQGFLNVLGRGSLVFPATHRLSMDRREQLFRLEERLTTLISALL